ncbi:uncharacterized protein BCR38DRAFT_355238 [Pseudomassariella vexata]|uniref:CBF1-interacting co-repressor CIR N-terminal domain-containing protein n=1 Tax=Pseudomassariella vexata TaxID=1141098 RepID=A0A1Y2DC82_9PEZI|nr:uncharacterized protein BCR38DRAFT_355238 [Pseudomassariella vexata]ORY56869.1 hypothetical protein BCR38DRAFT_355238 [Pseudomassariella vexata]
MAIPFHPPFVTSNTNSSLPSHLLGKKSWNVYNTDNIARVRRDEAAAQAREEAEEQRQQELDAEQRLAILRGEVPLPLSAPSTEEPLPTLKGRHHERDSTATWGKERKKRKRADEDDTDFELRVARERIGGTDTVAARDRNATTDDHMALQLQKRTTTSNAPLTNAAGHIDLFPQDLPSQPSEKNAEAEKEAAKKKREFQDQYQMRFSNAAGKNRVLSKAGAGAWYTNSGDIQSQEVPSKDVWGNEDPRRREREAQRVVSSDPLAMMKRGAAKVREVERERRVVNEEKERELRLLRKEKKAKRRKGDGDELEGFSLDDSVVRSSGAKPRRVDEERDRERRHRHHDDGGRHRHRSEHRHRHEGRHHGSRRDHESKDRHSDGKMRRESAKTDHD